MLPLCSVLLISLFCISNASYNLSRAALARFEASNLLWSTIACLEAGQQLPDEDYSDLAVSRTQEPFECRAEGARLEALERVTISASTKMGKEVLRYECILPAECLDRDSERKPDVVGGHGARSGVDRCRAFGPDT